MATIKRILITVITIIKTVRIKIIIIIIIIIIMLMFIQGKEDLLSLRNKLHTLNYIK